jgi:glucan phosphoethanolaminetransferase (alkaline phosphatase superfamily)
MKERNSKQKLIALAIAAAVLLNIPILETVNKPLLLFGFPLLYFYVFLVWLVLIIILYRLSRRNPS